MLLLCTGPVDHTAGLSLDEHPRPSLGDGMSSPMHAASGEVTGSNCRFTSETIESGSSSTQVFRLMEIIVFATQTDLLLVGLRLLARRTDEI